MHNRYQSYIWSPTSIMLSNQVFHVNVIRESIDYMDHSNAIETDTPPLQSNYWKQNFDIIKYVCCLSGHAVTASYLSYKNVTWLSCTIFYRKFAKTTNFVNNNIAIFSKCDFYNYSSCEPILALFANTDYEPMSRVLQIQ